MGHCAFCNKPISQRKAGSKEPTKVDGSTHAEARRGVCDACHAQVEEHGGTVGNWPKSARKALKERREAVEAKKAQEAM